LNGGQQKDVAHPPGLWEPRPRGDWEQGHFLRLSNRREGAAPTKPYTANLLNLMAVARTTVKRTVPAAFTASETFDVGVDLGSPVSLAYFDRAPFRFDGKIEGVKVELK